MPGFFTVPDFRGVTLRKLKCEDVPDLLKPRYPKGWEGLIQII